MLLRSQEVGYIKDCHSTSRNKVGGSLSIPPTMADSKRLQGSCIFSEHKHISCWWGLHREWIWLHIMSQTLPRRFRMPIREAISTDCIKFHLQNLSPLNRLLESPKGMADKVPCYLAAASIATEPSVFTFVSGGFESESDSDIGAGWPLQKESITLSLIWEETNLSISFTFLTIYQKFCLLPFMLLPFMEPVCSLKFQINKYK